jgi:hypothetical protein
MTKISMSLVGRRAAQDFGAEQQLCPAGKVKIFARRFLAKAGQLCFDGSTEFPYLSVSELYG